MKKQSKVKKPKAAHRARQIKEERAVYLFPLVINPKYALAYFDLPGKGIWGMTYSKPRRDGKWTEKDEEDLERVREAIDGLVRGKTVQEVINMGIIKNSL